jgi:hypothetical protein
MATYERTSSCTLHAFALHTSRPHSPPPGLSSVSGAVLCCCSPALGIFLGEGIHALGNHDDNHSEQSYAAVHQLLASSWEEGIQVLENHDDNHSEQSYAAVHQLLASSWGKGFTSWETTMTIILSSLMLLFTSSWHLLERKGFKSWKTTMTINSDQLVFWIKFLSRFRRPHTVVTTVYHSLKTET